ncbi:MAG: TlyA family RNA methyltransferase [Lachnospiraceae bacterium]|nr:TlyA family RNA methyltransferase [Lachnospiraceae bacterium]
MKERLDVILVQQGYAKSREAAKAIIMSGNVFVNGQREDKAGTAFETEGLQLTVKENPLKYVSRGGLKLEKAIETFSLKLEGFTCMDIGASTGGFTDCMLQNGAKKVYAIDVGHGQLDWKLRNDPRVVCMEKTNFRYVTGEQISESIDFASVDVSFISLSKILPAAYPLLAKDAQMVCLIKPQFEAGREKVGKKGVVRDKKVHEEVIMAVLSCCRQIGFEVLALTFSPIKGPEGNIEYLVHIQKQENRPLVNINQEMVNDNDRQVNINQKVVDINSDMVNISQHMVDINGEMMEETQAVRETVALAHAALE